MLQKSEGHLELRRKKEVAPSAPTPSDNLNEPVTYRLAAQDDIDSGVPVYRVTWYGKPTITYRVVRA